MAELQPLDGPRLRSRRNDRRQAMKLSNVLFVAGGLMGLPAFFVKVGALPMAAQIGWAVAVIGCGIAGGAAWASEAHSNE
ncbi:hypothetical protein WJ50_12925 [Burkholderia ubonensis]|nr:hypothetical protein WJ49_22795 [Burkholderia ubonensis]KVL73205.1 hypothetical protein WJ48_00490 [Burkholderia ubonensis]KVL91033.1 hypothetical protein WJ50_12925 [Burkholderia ubonensis]